MKPSQVFGIIIRTIGLSLLVYSVWYLVYGIATVAGGFPETHVGYKAAYFLSGITFLIVSLYFLRGAPHILRFSYPDEEKTDEKKGV